MNRIEIFGFLISLMMFSEYVNLRSLPNKVEDDGYQRQETEDFNALDVIISNNQAHKLKFLYEGDIDLREELQTRQNQQNISTRELVNYKRDAKRMREYLWKSRIVPFVISSDLGNYEYTIEKALEEIASKSCIRFVKKDNESNWIHFVRRAGCYSSVGVLYWTTGPQEISLGSDCLSYATVIHEVLHALGFWHEQSRPDRDDHVEILWENIIAGQEYNFEKYSHQKADVLEVQYDYSSVMHYGTKAFSKNGQDTIRPIRDTALELGIAQGLSKLDAIQLNALYDCKNANKSGWSAWSEFSPCDEKCFKYRQRFCNTAGSESCEGANEYGVQTQTVACKNDSTECYAPINGHWGRWGSWTSCSATCGTGTKNRTRQCIDPAPKFGGSFCEGSSTNQTSCRMRTCDLGVDDCEFDYGGFCHWKNDALNMGRYTWHRQSGETPSRNTGPNGDHTTSQGHYLYLESSSPAVQGDAAALISKSFTHQGPRCMNFYYHMSGSTVGSLKVYFENETSNTRAVLWHREGNQGQNWNRARIELKTQGTSYRIVFVGQRGSSYTGDIAIDDVLFKNGSCLDQPNSVDVKPTVSTTTSYRTTDHPINETKLHLKQIGCYRDVGYVDGKRPFPNYIDYRFEIDWRSMQKTVNKCAKKVNEMKYEYFAVEFYGECWYGSNAVINYARDGRTVDCWNGVGKVHTMMVYHWSP